MQRNKRTGVINLGEKNSQVKPEKRYDGFEGIIINIDNYDEKNQQVALKVLEGKYNLNKVYKVKTINTLMIPLENFYVEEVKKMLSKEVATAKNFGFQIPEIAMFREDMAKLRSKNL